MSKIRIDEEAASRITGFYQAIGMSLTIGAQTLAIHMRALDTLGRLRQLPDPWLQVWALHLGQTTRMSTDEAINYVWRKCGKWVGPITANELTQMKIEQNR